MIYCRGASSFGICPNSFIYLILLEMKLRFQTGKRENLSIFFKDILTHWLLRLNNPDMHGGDNSIHL